MCNGLKLLNGDAARASSAPTSAIGRRQVDRLICPASATLQFCAARVNASVTTPSVSNSGRGIPSGAPGP